MQLTGLKHIIALAVLLAVLGGLYYVATKMELFDTATRRASTIEAETKIIEQDIIAQLEQINSIKLDASVFQSEVYLSLEDRSVDLKDPELKRTNPFAPY